MVFLRLENCMSTKLGTLTLDLIARIGQFTEPLERAERQATESSSRIGSSFEGIGNLASKAMPMIAGLAGTVVGLAASYVTLDKVIDAQRTYDKQIAGLETATKSAENAKEAYSALSQFAAQTPYDMDQAIEGFTKLVNLGLTPSERAMKSYGNTASAMGKDLIQFIEAVADASTGEFERLKEFGIKSSKQGDEVAFSFQGTTTKIKNSSAAIEEYLMKIGENEFAGAMEKRMNSLDGSMSGLEDAWGDLALAISQAGIGELAKDATDMASEGVNGLTTLVASGAIETSLAGMEKAFSLFGGDAKSEMSGIVDAFGLSSDYLVEKWRATMIELNAIGNAWSMMRSWVQKATVSIAAGVDIVSDPFNKESSNASKQENWENSLKSIDDELNKRWDSISTSSKEAEQKYKTALLSQIKGANDTGDALAKYKIKAKDAGDTATEATKKANKELEKQKKLLDGLGSGLVSNANLKGLNIKSAESISGGKVRGYTAEFAQLANTVLGDSVNRFTAFNDSYHKGTNSKHATGNAFDFTLKDAKQAQQAVAMLEDVAKRYGYSIKILDEYKDPSKRATGGHLHVSVLGKKASEAWKDIQDEVGLIAKGHELVAKQDSDLAKQRLTVTKAYETEREKIERENAESILEIKNAFVDSDPNRQKYLDLQKVVYEKDLREFEKNQEAKRLAVYNSLNDPIYAMQSKGLDALANFAMTPVQKQEWQLNNEQQDGYSGLANDLGSARSAIEDNELLSAQQKYEQLENAYDVYLQNKAHLDAQYDQQYKDLAQSQQETQLSAWGNLLGQAQNTWGQITQSIKDANGEQSASFKAAFLAQQMFALGSAYVSTHLAAIQAMAAPDMVMFGQKIVASEAILAMGYANMALIGAQTIAGFATGGHITGKGTGTSDEIPIWASNGEYMLRTLAVNKIGKANLDYMNLTGELPYQYKFADGGLVGDVKVLNPEQNKGLANFFSDSNRRNAQPIVNVHTLPGTTAQVATNDDGTLDIRIKQLAEQVFTGQLRNANSNISKAVKQNTTASRRR